MDGQQSSGWTTVVRRKRRDVLRNKEELRQKFLALMLEYDIIDSSFNGALNVQFSCGGIRSSQLEEYNVM